MESSPSNCICIPSIENIGSFGEPGHQKQYIEHYIPGNESDAWKAFLERHGDGVRGR
jgi:hypothetical protein